MPDPTPIARRFGTRSRAPGGRQASRGRFRLLTAALCGALGSLVGTSTVAGQRASPMLAPPPAGERVALVRLASSQGVPADLLELEERITELLAARGLVVISAARAADVLRAPGSRFDRACDRLKEAILAAEAAHAAGNERAARRQLRDADDLLSLGSVVIVTPVRWLVRFHRIRAQILAATGQPDKERAARDLFGLLGVELGEDDGLATLRASLTETEEQAAGLAVEVSPANASILLDGQLLGTGAASRYDLAPGAHYLRVVAGGRESHGERLQLKPGGVIRREMRLVPLVDPLRSIATEVAGAEVPAPRVDALRALAGSLEAKRLLLLIPTEQNHVLLRHLEADGGEPHLAVRVPLSASGADLAALLGRVLDGRAPVAPATEITAVELAAEVPATPALLTTPVDQGTDTRWLWAGAGTAVVLGTVLAIVLATRPGAESTKATIWLCPGGAACAP